MTFLEHFFEPSVNFMALKNLKMCNIMKAKFLLSVCTAGEKGLPGIIENYRNVGWRKDRKQAGRLKAGMRNATVCARKLCCNAWELAIDQN